MTKAEQRARMMISKLTMAQLLDEWELTELAEPSMELATVRGWLMDEMEKRNPDAVSQWLEDDNMYADVRSYMM